MASISDSLSRLSQASAATASLVLASTVASQSLLDYCPTSRQVILNTNFTQIQPKNAPPINVAGGVFRFRNVTIPAGVTVRATGTNPMVWLVSGDFIVDGELSVTGGDGERVNTLASANFPTAGGSGHAGGGNGGRGSPNAVGQSAHGEAGYGASQVPSLGGGGGLLGLIAGCGRGSGGGGGAFASVGDPYYKVKAGLGTSFVQQLGIGGYGCVGASGAASRVLPGGAAGRSVFLDDRADNDFYGLGFNVQQGRVIVGELPAPIGGTGGGGGGDLTARISDGNFINDAKGGGGGAGGGVLMIIASGSIQIGPNGVLSANGGNGGGGEQAGSSNRGGGGGAGSGGMLILGSMDEIVLHAHGETYANDDYDFALSADGGVGTQSNFAALAINGKYPPPAAGAQWDSAPAGAFGGLGVVQLFTVPGTNADGTNTILDDNVRVVRGGQDLTGVEKTRYLAWRGYPNQQGVWVDDSNNPTYNNDPSTAGYPAWASSPDDAGDIRPAPILLPVPR